MAFLRRALTLASAGLLTASALTLASTGLLQSDGIITPPTESYAPYVKPVPYYTPQIYLAPDLPPRSYTYGAKIEIDPISRSIGDVLPTPIDHHSIIDVPLTIGSQSIGARYAKYIDYQTFIDIGLSFESNTTVDTELNQYSVLYQMPVDPDEYRGGGKLKIFSITKIDKEEVQIGSYHVDIEHDLNVYSKTVMKYDTENYSASYNGYKTNEVHVRCAIDFGLTDNSSITYTTDNNQYKRTIQLRSNARVEYHS
ncbi:MAG: hypothetical protein KAS32_23100 [Candidatus Peribacteraceae bacterium]|nr:hypothetical protein [Candidatus Peribacteraceae bacterium]